MTAKEAARKAVELKNHFLDGYKRNHAEPDPGWEVELLAGCFARAMTAEREKCMKVADERAAYYRGFRDHASAGAAREISILIRERT